MENSVRALENLITSLGEKPEFNCIEKSRFECECRALGEVVTASAYSSEDAQEIAAQLMLQKISLKGKPNTPQQVAASQNLVAEPNVIIVPEASSCSLIPVPNYVALLEEFCRPLLLSPVNCELKQVFLPALIQKRQPVVKTSEGNLMICSLIGQEKCHAARRFLEKKVPPEDVEGALQEVALILGMTVEFCEFKCADGMLCFVKLMSKLPPLSFGDAADGRAAASQKALDYIRTLLDHHPSPTITITSVNLSRNIQTIIEFK